MAANDHQTARLIRGIVYAPRAGTMITMFEDFSLRMFLLALAAVSIIGAAWRPVRAVALYFEARASYWNARAAYYKSLTQKTR